MPTYADHKYCFATKVVIFSVPNATVGKLHMQRTKLSKVDKPKMNKSKLIKSVSKLSAERVKCCGLIGADTSPLVTD